jgi:hypothetical protein
VTGRIDTLTADRVTINGTPYAFAEAVRWVLELSALDGCELDFAVIDGAITKVCRVYPAVRS